MELTKEFIDTAIAADEIELQAMDAKRKEIECAEARKIAEADKAEAAKATKTYE